DEHLLGEGYIAETGFILARDPDSLLAPDFGFIRRERLGDGGQRPGYSDTVPDLAVEIRSPSDYPKLLERKVTAYMRAGTRLLWFVEPFKHTVTVYRPSQPEQVLAERDELDGEDVLPGFRLPVE